MKRKLNRNYVAKQLTSPEFRTRTTTDKSKYKRKKSINKIKEYLE